MKFATVTSQAKNQDYRQIYVIIDIPTQQCCMQNFGIKFYKQDLCMLKLILSTSRYTNKNSNL